MLRMLIVAWSAVSLAGGAAATAQPKQPPVVTAAPKPIARSELMSKLDTSFAAADANHDGYLNASELQAMQQKSLQQLEARARAELQARFNQLDTNKDGKLSFDEFVAIATVRPNQTPEQILQRLDTNHDGKVSPDEAKAPDIAAFNRLDANHDGVISVQEQMSARQKK